MFVLKARDSERGLLGKAWRRGLGAGRIRIPVKNERLFTATQCGPFCSSKQKHFDFIHESIHRKKTLHVVFGTAKMSPPAP